MGWLAAGRWGWVSLALILPGLCRGAESDAPALDFLEEKLEGETVLSARNTNLAEITVLLELSLTNLVSNVKLPRLAVCAPASTTELARLKPIDSRRGWGWQRHCTYTWGSPWVRHDPRALYLLPYAPGESHVLVQGRGGSFSHQGENYNALDFAMDPGTLVHAARGGVVVLARDGFEAGGPDRALQDRANVIYIRHTDGTLGEYAHLAPHGALVRAGDRVVAGQAIGHSGNTGYSAGPHLHFAVFRARDGRGIESFPLRFVTREGQGISLEAYRAYTAVSATAPPAAGSSRNRAASSGSR